MWNAAKESVSDLAGAIVDTSAWETIKSIKGVGGVGIDATKWTIKLPNQIGSNIWEGAKTVGSGVFEGAKAVGTGGLNVVKKAGKKIERTFPMT